MLKESAVRNLYLGGGQGPCEATVKTGLHTFTVLCTKRRIPQRQPCGEFDLLHGKAGTDVGDTGNADQLFVHRVVTRDVGNDDAQQVVGVAGHAVALDDFGQVADGVVELFEPGGVVLVGADGGEDTDGDIQALRVQQGYAAVDDAGLFQLLNASPAGGAAQADAFGDVRDRARAVGLQNVEDGSVELVHGRVPCLWFGLCIGRDAS